MTCFPIPTMTVVNCFNLFSQSKPEEAPVLHGLTLRWWICIRVCLQAFEVVSGRRVQDAIERIDHSRLRSAAHRRLPRARASTLQQRRSSACALVFAADVPNRSPLLRMIPTLLEFGRPDGTMPPRLLRSFCQARHRALRTPFEQSTATTTASCACMCRSICVLRTSSDIFSGENNTGSMTVSPS